MRTPRTFIIIKGQPKALQIDTFRLLDNRVFQVKFKSSEQIYHYACRDVIWLQKSVWHNPAQCKVYVNQHEIEHLSDIWSFDDGEKRHWRVQCNDGTTQDFLDGMLTVKESCLSDETAKNAFEYLQQIAARNEIGKEDNKDSMLASLYGEMDFVNQEAALATYLNPKKFNNVPRPAPYLIFPFGCNSSQAKAVSSAFTHPISVIEGPPGTGKTQTILNIIANILIQGKTVMVVSNNNAATANVQEKLEKYGFNFVVAALGNKKNKEAFILSLPTIPDDIDSWACVPEKAAEKKVNVQRLLDELKHVFDLQETLAVSKSELQALRLEWTHFKQEHGIDDQTFTANRSVASSHYLQLWLKYQSVSERMVSADSTWIQKWNARLKWFWMKFEWKFILKIKTPLNRHQPDSAFVELQSRFYQIRNEELIQTIDSAEEDLKNIQAQHILDQLTSESIVLLKDYLYQRFHNVEEPKYENAGHLRWNIQEVCQRFPVVLSTTFSARTCLDKKYLFDYLIMDEASQVAIETGALALSCARHAVIVGDPKQLPNVVTEDDKVKLSTLFSQFHLAEGYDASQYSFLDSVVSIIPDIQTTLLREHYRCHPQIINFCNQKFYGNNLLIMTEDLGETDTMKVITTVPGHHARGHLNQREIDVVKQEILPTLDEDSDAGIITPYNDQVDAFNQQLTDYEAATVHKYQGREKDTIIMSVTDDQITPFSDDPNLLNVAVSRAKKHFYLVVSGNEQEQPGNICELIEYIRYHNFTVQQSKVRSIFDYLYSNYTEQRIAFLSQHPQISAYDSENLTFNLLLQILQEEDRFAHLGIVCHIPLRTVIADTSLMSEEERTYAAHYSTHLDFLLINHVNKKPVLAVETDGFAFHNAQTLQHQRDLKKDHILELYGIPFLRLSTTGSGEKERIVQALDEIVR